MANELLDWAEKQLARQCDPSTSRKAASEIKAKLPNRFEQFLTGLRALGQATSNEVAEHVAPGNFGLFGSVRRRASDALARGMIRVVGKRPCKVTGKEANVYEVSE